MRVITNYKTNANGRGQIVAKSCGMQRTMNYDQSQSSDWNHGTAAAIAVQTVCDNTTQTVEAVVRSIDFGYSTHETNDSGSRHVFDL